MAKLAVDSASLEFLVINREIFIQNREIGRFSVFLSKIGRCPAKSGDLEALVSLLKKVDFMALLLLEERARDRQAVPPQHIHPSLFLVPHPNLPIGEFVQLMMPLHSPHATQQSSLCFLQEHLRVSQSCLHVHLTTSRRASGAGGRSVIIGSRRFRTRSQPNSSGSRSSPFPYTAALANTPERCGKTLLPMWEADCVAAQLCCFSIHSRGTIGNAKHPGPRQSILCTSYVGLHSALSPADTMLSRNSLPHST